MTLHQIGNVHAMMDLCSEAKTFFWLFAAVIDQLASVCLLEPGLSH